MLGFFRKMFRLKASMQPAVTPVATAPGGAPALLLETGSYLLLESGDKILLE